ncbi:hypothetical protein M5X00_18030 [Paenibacillus alvei]|uniref:hypothetical protein n=1 Tax=Paenibacillus alvei TaxID=44250 RepID=UPI000288DFD1|nr:hypothetical protein [Paenibacillus alvei]EJW16783.1 hypothetical protein PAV_5c03660 [Paenibacillus alvei DSM 29]MCY9542878.1 hypothetical protein [Paenibacillus alvei]MCY9705118.1 hypothetical protein [Paenibacillus alvei]MCY9737782.1 hypothetical protein [Paenibacillus alvei]MCY9756141.1 hypothetical protein [Paenibacillus alvei]
MAKPNTDGIERDFILEMEVGDYICMQVYENGSPFEFTGGVSPWVGTGSNFMAIPEIDYSGAEINSARGIFYFIKVDEGLLIADRVIKTIISYNELKGTKDNNYIQGKAMTLNGVYGYMRCLTGGVGLINEKGSIENDPSKAILGAYPIDNEYDKYIVNSNLNGTIKANDHDVWHHFNYKTITQCTDYLNPEVCITRGGNLNGAGFEKYDVAKRASYGINKIGFRPVFDFRHLYEVK